MNQSTGNLEIPEINISDMPPDRFMPFQRIWQHTFLLTSKYFLQFLGYFSYHWYKLTGTKMAMPQVFHLFWKVVICHWKFNKGNLTLYSVTCNRHVLHRYANEDVSIGAWFIGLDVNHIDDRRLCCGTPPGS